MDCAWRLTTSDDEAITSREESSQNDKDVNWNDVTSQRQMMALTHLEEQSFPAEKVTYTSTLSPPREKKWGKGPKPEQASEEEKLK